MPMLDINRIRAGTAIVSPCTMDTELFRLQGLSQFHCFAPIIVIQKYARQMSCCDFAVPNYSFHFNIHIFAWRSIGFLQISSEAASGHTHLNQTSDSSV